MADSWTIKADKPCKRLVLYYHDIIFNGTNVFNATSAAIVKEPNLGSHHFGLMVVFDDPITKDRHLLSPPIARA
nr:dirigent protein 5-like [Ipomoea batatas]GMC98570.1 dirigent protein 5-like [Ipomoea batatas]